MKSISFRYAAHQYLRIAVLRIFCTLVALAISTPSFAAGDTGPRNIVGMGCHENDTTCWLTLDVASYGPASCSGTQARWNVGSANGKVIMSLLMMGYASGKKVSLEVGAACYAPQPIAPTFN